LTSFRSVLSLSQVETHNTRTQNMSTITIHNTVKIVAEKPMAIGDDNGYCRDILITDRKGFTTTINIFYDDKDKDGLFVIES